jgi:hypothetical protein
LNTKSLCSLLFDLFVSAFFQTEAPSAAPFRATQIIENVIHISEN